MTYTDNINFREKYLKYKRKYFYLKNFHNIKDLHGGYYLPDIDRTSQTFVDINNQNETELLLSNKFIGNSRNLNPQVTKYLDLLENLLQKKDNLTINLDFINDFNRYIYYDLNNTYSINSRKERNIDIFNFSNPDKVSYKIAKTLTNTDNSTIFLLEKVSDRDSHRDLPQYQILKIYNGGIDETDYLSLEIGRITNNPQKITLTPNYYELTEAQFNDWNYNDISMDDLLKTNTINNAPEIFDRLYLSCKNINPINDFIINLILEKITLNNLFPNNFVKYHNLFITNINGVKRYCVIMDQMNGTIKDLYNFLNINIQDDKKIEFIRLIILNILIDIHNILILLKQKQFLFTHTDLKLENVFYKNSLISERDFREKIDRDKVKEYTTIEYKETHIFKSNYYCVDNKIFEKK